MCRSQAPPPTQVTDALKRADAAQKARDCIAQARIRAAAMLPAPRPIGWEREVTLVVTAYERPACVAHFLQAARQAFPSLPVLVCDASAQSLFAHDTALGPRTRWITLPKDRGHAVGASRNYALSFVQTPLFFLCDDDHVLGPHTHLRRMSEFLHLHDFDIVGGCQGKNDYGSAIFVLHGRRLEQRFFWHHGRVAPGAVRCDRVSNTFLARTARVREVGWEERVHGDEHAEFFWRARLAGLRVAQLGGTYVRHERHRERASHVWSQLLRAFVDHPDRAYLQRRMGGDAQTARQAHAAHCLAKNGLSAIVSRARWRDKRAFLRLMYER